MEFKNILFDLDGTLTDPALGITNSILYAMKKFKLPLIPREELYVFIGPPLLSSFQKHFGVTADESKIMLTYYREYFSDKGLFENTVYPHIEDSLKNLKERGHQLYLATSKPEPYAKKILAHFNLDLYFSFIGGSTLEETRTEKDEVIRYVMEKNNLDPHETLMVGDRSYDIIGAHQCGLKAMGVLYGYGDQKELQNADFIIATPSQLKEIQ